MKVYQTNEIKNIALLGNDGSGKTTLTESLLFESGIIKRRGRITFLHRISVSRWQVSRLWPSMPACKGRGLFLPYEQIR